MKRVEIWYCVSSLTDSQTATLSIETNPKTINCYLKKKVKKNTCIGICCNSHSFR